MSEVRSTKYGQIHGVKMDGYTIYKGIPYAKPPIGELRWKAPQEPKQWKGVRNCDQFADIPWQPEGWVGVSALEENHQNEDCLYLNIWEPEHIGGKAPVLVWIHGGGFMGGCAHEALYDGKKFAEQGIIVVTIAYRLGVFGFLTLPELEQESEARVSGNYGILDQIAALKWVRENIFAFGGDPENVTIDGQSAGGMSVGILMSSPLTEGLFQRAILQSAGPTPGLLPDYAAELEIGKKLQQNTGAEDLKELRGIPADQLVKVEIQGDLSMEPAFHAAVDGYVLKQNPYEAFLDKKVHQIPLVIGNTCDEAVFAESGEATTRDVKKFTEKLIKIHTEPVYRYLFSRQAVLDEGINLGAGHSAELAFVFDTLETRRNNKIPDGRIISVKNSAQDEALAQKINSAWAAFVKGGEPWTSVQDGGEMIFD